MASEQTSHPEHCQESLVRRRGWEVAVKFAMKARKDQPLSLSGPPKAMAVCPLVLDTTRWPSSHKKPESLFFLRSLGEVSQNSVTWFLARVLVKLLNCADFSSELECISLSQRGSKQGQDGSRKEGALLSLATGSPSFPFFLQRPWGGCS